jgi:hypothetical protein
MIPTPFLSMFLLHQEQPYTTPYTAMLIVDHHPFVMLWNIVYYDLIWVITIIIVSRCNFILPPSPLVSNGAIRLYSLFARVVA